MMSDDETHVLKKNLKSNQELELHTPLACFLNQMTTAPTGPHLGDEDSLELLQQPPHLEETMHDLRERARALVRNKIMELPLLEQAALIAGTFITLKELELLVEHPQPTTSTREMEIALIINEMNNEGMLETTPTGNVAQLHCRCLLTNETTTCLQIEHDNPLGLQTPYPDIWKSCHKPESRDPDEEKNTNRLCACGEEFQSEQERDAHCAANVTSGAHGCTSDRLEKIGGAHVWMDPNTGKVLQAKAYPLPHQGLGPVSSTRYEAATLVQATLGLIALCETEDTQRNPEHPIKEATLSTDSQGSVDAYESQVLKFTTAPKKSKSPLQDHMNNMKATSGTLQPS